MSIAFICKKLIRDQIPSVSLSKQITKWINNSNRETIFFIGIKLIIECLLLYWEVRRKITENLTIKH